MVRHYIQYFLLVVILIPGCTPVDDTSPSQEDFFVKFYGDSQVETGDDVLITDTGYLVFGSTNSPTLNSNGGDDVDFFLVFTDFEGNETNRLSFGTEFDEVPKRIKPTSDGGYIMVGTTTIFNAGDPSTNVDDSQHTNVIVYKLDASGTEQWSYNYGFAKTTPVNTADIEDSNEEGYDVVETTDGDFVVLGTTNNVRTNKDNPNPDTDIADLYLFKISGTGADNSMIWQRIDGFVGNDQGRSLVTINGGGFAVMGNTDVEKDGSGGGTNIIFLTANDEGLNRQFKVFGSGDDSNDFASKMKPTSDEGFIIVGTAATAAGNRTILMKVTANRTLTFFETLEVNEEVTTAGVASRTGNPINNDGNDVIELSTGGYLVVGKRTGGFLEGDPSGEDIYLIKTDPFGKLTEGETTELKEGLFERKFGGLGNDQANAIVELPSGKLVIAGTNDFGGTNSTMMTLMKLNRRGELLR
ncbi:MAG: hypothetical protein RIG77_14095 [Cyclobacteriaceae bacterium]